MARKRISKKTRDVIQSLIFFTSTMAIISCLIMYLWVYTEIDETLLAIEIQNSTAKELQNGIQLILYLQNLMWGIGALTVTIKQHVLNIDKVLVRTI